ncbi:MAG: flagellar hook-basal body complex protein [Planctomycetes bacterium]|nr:flagellar hook-basal body complex protein [Planctomycetota bacterium]
MGLTSAMNTAVTGLQTSQVMLETIGDNIANVNTTAFKSNRVDLESQFALTLRGATAPGDVLGGTNPVQVGLGSAVGAIQRSFVQGSIAPTGSNSDLAIQGQGFFVLEDADGAQLYTRDGAFTLDANSQLVSRDGLLVQAFIADANGEVDSSGAVGSVTIPLGALKLARATSEVSVGGNLNAASSVASTGAVVTSDALITGTGVATAGTALTTLIDAQGNALFADGDLVTLSGATKGGFALPGDEQFTIGTDGTTVQDFMTFLEGALAIHTDPALGENAGVTLDAAGQMVIAGNFGESNALEIEAGNIVNTTQGTIPFAFTQTSAAAGEGLTMQLDLFDSLGGPVSARLRLALESKTDAGTIWRFYAESVDDSDVSNVLGTGTISFDPNGQFIGATGNELSIDHANSGAASPLAFTVDFAAATGLSDGSGSSTFTQLDQDGLPEGTLQDFAVDEEGFIIGTFSNAHQQVLGQVALATFVNPHGLKLATDNNYVVTANSGDANITAPKESNAGRIKPGSLELSNVDLAREFIGLINASTGFSANSRVITTADELLQELLLIAR